MRCGLFLPQGWRLDLVDIPADCHWTLISDLAHHADRGPWDSVWVYDHFHTSPLTHHEATHEAWSLMAALAATTGRVRLGQMCTCAGYRNPAYLGKVAATVDIISGGRLEMGIGAGWYEHEWRAYGYGFPAARDRLGLLDETVQVLRQMWRTGSATLDGHYVHVDDARCAPLPLQAAGPPLWIAGGGERKTLRIAAQYANYTNFDGTLEAFTHKSAVLDEHCAAVGRNPHDICRSANFNVAIGRNDADVAQRLQTLHSTMARKVGAAEADRQLGAYRDLPACGTPSQIIDNLGQLHDAGLDYALFYFPEIAYDRSGLELFETEVLPALT